MSADEQIAEIRAFLEGNGYQVVNLGDGRSAVALDNAAPLAALDTLAARVPGSSAVPAEVAKGPGAVRSGPALDPFARAILEHVVEAEAIDRRMGYPLNGTSALQAALCSVDEILARAAVFAPEDPQT